MAAKPKYSYLPILKLARKLSPVWPSGIQAAATITFPYIAEETFDTDGQEDFVSMFIAKVLFFRMTASKNTSDPLVKPASFPPKSSLCLTFLNIYGIIIFRKLRLFKISIRRYCL